MQSNTSSFIASSRPEFFVTVPQRDLTTEEVAVVKRLLKNQSSQFREQLHTLKVVGRCGCRACPTVFFRAHVAGAKETDLVVMQGRDNVGGLVAAILLHDNGRLSQLEFYSVDGHEPWLAPCADTLSPV